MYMIAGLCMLKLYQKRHPDINASAYTAYACLAMVIFFSVLGVVRLHAALLTFWKQNLRRVCCCPLQVFGKGNMVFWIVFSIIHILATLLLSTQLYYMGRWKLGKLSTLLTLQTAPGEPLARPLPPLLIPTKVSLNVRLQSFVCALS